MKKKQDIIIIESSALKFMRIKNAFELSKLLQVEFLDFVRIIESVNYREFSIPKTKGGKRTIEAPNELMTIVQKRLNSYLQMAYYMLRPDEVYGFVQSASKENNPKNIVTNARNHIGKNYLLNIDLKDFFHSISTDQVRTLFQSAPYNFKEDLATCLALICCWKGRLPMGAATSPVISNLFCLGLDHQLIELAKNNELTYTRYADDLTFSSNAKISEEVIAKIKKVIAQNNFNVNEKKFRLQSKFRQQTVTGIKVNVKPNVDRRYIRKIRAILNDIKWNGVNKAATKHFRALQAEKGLISKFVLSIEGKIGFIGQVRGKEDLIYLKLRKEFQEYQPKTIRK